MNRRATLRKARDVAGAWNGWSYRIDVQEKSGRWSWLIHGQVSLSQCPDVTAATRHVASMAGPSVPIEVIE